MVRRLEDFLETTQSLTTIGALTAHFRHRMAEEGYDNVTAVVVGGAVPLDVIAAHVPLGFPEFYRERDWSVVDPILRQARRTNQPVVWNRVADESAVTRRERRFLDDSRAMGVHGGVTMPFHGPDGRIFLCGVSLRGAVSPDPRRIPYLHALAAQVWIRLGALRDAETGRLQRRPLGWAHPNDKPSLSFQRERASDRTQKSATFASDALTGRKPLTPRERECLIWAKDGKTNWEISQILAVAERTVEFHLGNVMRKLNATCRITAIVVALHEGIIPM